MRWHFLGLWEVVYASARCLLSAAPFERWLYVCCMMPAITFGLFPSNWFVSSQTNAMKCLVKWNPLRFRVRSENTQPCLTLRVECGSIKSVLSFLNSWARPSLSHFEEISNSFKVGKQLTGRLLTSWYWEQERVSGNSSATFSQITNENRDSATHYLKLGKKKGESFTYIYCIFSPRVIKKEMFARNWLCEHLSKVRAWALFVSFGKKRLSLRSQPASIPALYTYIRIDWYL